MKNSSSKLGILSSILVMALTVTHSSYAGESENPRAAFKAELLKKTGSLGPFARSEDFPKSYFLIPQNLPFMVELSLHHPMSKTLKLTDEQKGKIKKIKETTVPVVVKAGTKIKQLEIALAQKFIDGATLSDMEKQVDEISALRTDLTKKHLVCIDQVRAILTPEQFKTLQEYTSPKAK